VNTLIKSLIAFVPISMLIAGSAISFSRSRAFHAALQLLGAAFLTLVILAHISEALRLFPWMGWGQQQSVGHYLDLTGAVLGGMLFPVGYLLQNLSKTSKSNAS
jgi:hypothetical protein